MYTLRQDYWGAWYVIPLVKSLEFHEWTDGGCPGWVPEYAVRILYPQDLLFKDFETGLRTRG